MRTLLLAALLTLLVPAVAHATTVSVRFLPDEKLGDTSDLDVVAAPGERNRLTLAPAGGSGRPAILVADTGAPVTPGAGCVALNPHGVLCSPTADWGQLHVAAGDEDDRVDVTALHDVAITTVLDGGAGNDVLRGSARRFAQGGTLIGGPGDDVLVGGSGSARFVGGTGDDVLRGGAGLRDIADYSDRRGAVHVDLARGTMRGAGDRDRLSGIEDVTGGAGRDVLLGDRHSNRLSQGTGTAGGRIDGRGRDDTLTGDLGSDVLVGGDGSDRIAGTPTRLGSDPEPRPDRVLGGDGDDTVTAGPGSISLGPGRDRVELVGVSRAPRSVSCGSGEDVATVGPDPVPLGSDCERVLRDLLSARVRPRLQGRTLSLLVTCARRCMATLTVHAGAVLLGRGQRTIAAGTAGRVVVRLRRPARQLTLTLRGEELLPAGAPRRYVLRRTLAWRVTRGH